MCSARGSSAIAATVCATRSPTVGTPRILVPPEAFGISTARTGGGKYVPDDIRFQILYKLLPRSALKSSMVTPSAPGAPPLTATRFHACHTRRLGMSNGFPSCPDMLTRLLPGQQPRLLGIASPDEPAPSLRPHYTGIGTTTGRSASARRDGTQHLAVSAAWCAPSRVPHPRGRSISARLPVFPHASRRPDSRHLHAGHRLASKRVSARLIPERALSPRF